MINKSSVGNAKIAGLTQDIDITDNQYNWALSIFFIGYVWTESSSTEAFGWMAEIR